MNVNTESRIGTWPSVLMKHGPIEALRTFDETLCQIATPSVLMKHGPIEASK